MQQLNEIRTISAEEIKMQNEFTFRYACGENCCRLSSSSCCNIYCLRLLSVLSISYCGAPAWMQSDAEGGCLYLARSFAAESKAGVISMQHIVDSTVEVLIIIIEPRWHRQRSLCTTSDLLQGPVLVPALFRVILGHHQAGPSRWDAIALPVLLTLRRCMSSLCLIASSRQCPAIALCLLLLRWA